MGRGTLFSEIEIRRLRIGVAIETPIEIYQASHELSRLTFLKIIELIF